MAHTKIGVRLIFRERRSGHMDSVHNKFGENPLGIHYVDSAVNVFDLDFPDVDNEESNAVDLDFPDVDNEESNSRMP